MNIDNELFNLEKELSEVEAEIEAEKKEQSFSSEDEKILHILDKMAKEHAEFLYHAREARKHFIAGQDLNSRIAKIVQKRSEAFQTVTDNDVPESARPTIEEIVEMIMKGAKL